MKLPTVHVTESHLTHSDLAAYEQKMKAELARLQEASLGFYEDDRASINLPFDLNHVRLVKALAAKHKAASLLIIVGIGGSNLGTMAVQEALLGKLHNLKPGKRPRVLCLDTTDSATVQAVHDLMAAELRQRRNIVINVISKSGTTTETVANFEVLLATLKKSRKNYRDFVVVTTDEGSPLWHTAAEEGFTALPIPKKVGGRYSVFSPVGLFPLALLGIDVKKLLDGAAHMRNICIREQDNPAMLRAALLAHEWAHGKTIADNFYFASDLESIGKWYRQLMGESIGKEWNREHTKQLMTGISPTVSIGSTDLHSMAQLYFGGPNDKFFTIVTTAKHRHEVAIPKMPKYDSLVHNIQGRRLSSITHAISEATMKTLAKYQRPYCHIELSHIDESSIGALLQLHMMEMMFLAALLDVNAFDQPNVETYKIETKKILARRSR